MIRFMTGHKLASHPIKFGVTCYVPAVGT